MDLNSIYTELIMEHSQSGHNEKKLGQCTHCKRGHNPSCGDEITLELIIEEDMIKDAAFHGMGCAISKASTSMMIDLIKGKTKEEALSLVDTFIGMIKKDITDDEELEQLEDAMVLKNISNLPARVKCAVLAWHTLKESLQVSS
ncbi:SUF system NifU family Fe-S cluster assembly protein [Irregularibacter muris]|uniref:SUF system NifU family Fe-S cluster assembly protein n=1 Tax=Irregularibacter muris TaxID=1796619 RepID=A0AAE3L2V1_9FIRM|nr:SUF system NifU family Fe-S cluster assembly protein [Irregularibacter muris]MCR1899339.1 SUF system NifU family Fe-S cluster assembly protein [Irregularibacter muris]